MCRMLCGVLLPVPSNTFTHYKEQLSVKGVQRNALIDLSSQGSKRSTNASTTLMHGLYGLIVYLWWADKT